MRRRSRRSPTRRRAAALCELNVIEQVVHVCQTTAVSDAWERGQDLTVHGCVYGLHDGLLRDLGLSVAGTTDAGHAYAKALGDLGRLWSGQAAIGVSIMRRGDTSSRPAARDRS